MATMHKLGGEGGGGDNLHINGLSEPYFKDSLNFDFQIEPHNKRQRVREKNDKERYIQCLSAGQL